MHWQLHRPESLLHRMKVQVFLFFDNAFTVLQIVFDGDGSDQRIQHKSALNATEEFSKEFSHPMGLSLWAMYQGIVVILLLNILIAMMV